MANANHAASIRQQIKVAAICIETLLRRSFDAETCGDGDSAQDHRQVASLYSASAFELAAQLGPHRLA